MLSYLEVPFSPPDISQAEIDEVVEALRSGWITTGSRTKQFEGEIAAYCGADRAVCLNSATAALELTLRRLGVGPGDEVITSAYTYTASASAICHVGATPVLVDTAKNSYHMDPSRLEAALTERTKAVIPVDVAGIPCDYAQIFALLQAKSGLFSPCSPIGERIGRAALVSDAAHAFGASYRGRRIGSVADFTCFSFHAVKNLTTAEGGAVTFSSPDSAFLDEVYQEYTLDSLHGQSKDALAKTTIGGWEYDILTLGYKCNMTDLQAALGLAQLQRYEKMLARRRELCERYDAAFAGTRVKPAVHSGPGFLSSRHLYLTRIEGFSRLERDEAIRRMAERGVAVNVHYKPLPMLTAYRRLGFRIEDYQNALAQFENEITLPLHTLLTDDQADHVINCLLEAIQ